MKNILRALLFMPSLLWAQAFSGGFTFTLPYYDTTAQQFFPSFPSVPLDNQAFIGINADGHFALNGSAIRFWGTNIVGSGVFPEKKYDAVIAGRLRKMGFNLIRFHHMDNAWGDGTSLFDWQSDTRHLNADRLDKLENLIAELKKNGIYADINLHVARTYSAKDGVPDADSLADSRYGPAMSKGIYYFDPQLRQLNKEYARQLLTHVNPYTGLPLVSDPVMAMVELTNEDLLVRMWREGALKPYAMGGSLTIRHTKMLDSLWNAFLKKKYATAAAFANAWNAGSVAEGTDNQVRNGGFETPPITTQWQLELDSQKVATGTMSLEPTAPATGVFCGRVDVTMASSTSWVIQFKQTGLSIVKDSTYVVKFSVRSDAARAIDFSVMKNGSPYTGYAWMSALALGPIWKTYSFSFRAPETNSGDVRLAFQLGGQKGTYWFDDVVMAASGIEGVPPGSDFDRGTVRRIEYADCKGITDQRVRDISDFYIGISRDCLRDMKSFIHDSLGVKVPVTGTNSFADQAEIATQSEMDYIDNHAYWDHPSFPTVAWSSTDWLISNTAMVNGADWSTFPALTAGVGIKGKPLTISEYNHPYPNRYQVEGPIFLAAYSAFQSVDGIMIYAYNEGTDYTLDDINSYFDIHRNTALMALMPSCAYAYRMGLIAPARQNLVMDFAAQDILQMPKDNAAVVFNKQTALVHGLRASGYAAAASTASTFTSGAASPYTTDTREIVWNTQTGMLTAVTPRFTAAAGFFAATPGQASGAMTIKTATDFAAITWLSLTSDSLAASRRSVLTLSTRVQNTGQIWDGTHTFHNNWGVGPTQMQAVRAELRLRMAADSLHLFPLSVTGATRGAPVTIVPSAADRQAFDVTLDQNASATVWYGLEAFGAGEAATAASKDAIAPKEFSLMQNYPNPFNPSTVITYELPKQADVMLTVYDLLGREVATLVNEEEHAGRHSVMFSADKSRISSGMYFYQLRAGIFSAQRTMLILK